MLSQSSENGTTNLSTSSSDSTDNPYRQPPEDVVCFFQYFLPTHSRIMRAWDRTPRPARTSGFNGRKIRKRRIPMVCNHRRPLDNLLEEVRAAKRRCCWGIWIAAGQSEEDTVVPEKPRIVPPTEDHEDAHMLQEFVHRVNAKKAETGKLADAVKPCETGLTRPEVRRRIPPQLLDQNSPSPDRMPAPIPTVCASGHERRHEQASGKGLDATRGRAPAIRRHARQRHPPDSRPRSAPRTAMIVSVRRPADESQPVILPKPAAQQLAALTKANTKRNRKEPLGSSSPPRRRRKSGRKTAPKKHVTWDETLVYFHDAGKASPGRSNELHETDPRHVERSLGRRLRSRT